MSPAERAAAASTEIPPLSGTIRWVRPDDAAAICDVYNPYIVDSTVSFEELPVTAAVMRERIEAMGSDYPWLVAMRADSLVGYAYANAWRPRAAYRHALESTIYLQPGHTGQGLGTELYTTLIAEVRGRGFRTLLGGIALPNPASVALHEKLGFEKVAHLAEVGFKCGRWIDVGYWQLLL